MSYNISSWKTRHLHLELPVDFDFQQWLTTQPNRDEKGYENVGKRWCLEEEEHVQADLVGNTWRLLLIGDCDLSGIIENNLLSVTDLNCSGEFSGQDRKS